MYTVIPVFMYTCVCIYSYTCVFVPMYTIILVYLYLCIQLYLCTEIVKLFTIGYKTVTTRCQIEILYHIRPEKVKSFFDRNLHKFSHPKLCRMHK